ncbi:DUF4411 family protein [Candidatus Peregrinibacteria bacterium]|nr:DUF4411 family protein [Candidatus Peregrinibacteria bacterium]
MINLQKHKNIYCFDTSAFLTLSRTSENIIELPETLWEHLELMMKSSELISHKIVYDEISSKNKNPDFITKWILNKKDYFLERTNTQIIEVSKIVKQFSSLIDINCEKEQADPWVIALAIEKSKDDNLFEVFTSIVVSQESLTSTKTIPAVCKAFGIRHLSLRTFFNEIGLSASILKKES